MQRLRRAPLCLPTGGLLRLCAQPAAGQRQSVRRATLTCRSLPGMMQVAAAAEAAVSGGAGGGPARHLLGRLVEECGGGVCKQYDQECTVTCFAGSGMVQVEGRGPTPLHSLRTGDRVLTASGASASGGLRCCCAAREPPPPAASWLPLAACTA